MVLSSNSIIHIAQNSRRIVLPVNGWQARTSDHSLSTLTEEEKQRNVKLEGSYAVFADNKTLFVLLVDGTVYPVEVHADGRAVSKLTMGSALAQTTIPSVVRQVEGQHLFIGSTVGPSVLLKAQHIEEDIPEDDVEMSAPVAVVDTAKDVDMDDDDGESTRQVIFHAIVITSSRLIRYIQP